MTSLSGFIENLAKVLILHLALVVTALPAATSSLRGSVTDSMGLVIARAEVTVTNNSTNSVRRTVTDASGLYFVPELPPGVYQIDVSRPGFQRVSQPDGADDGGP